MTQKKPERLSPNTGFRLVGAALGSSQPAGVKMQSVWIALAANRGMDT
jgi:hypothetical protein